MLFWVLSFMKIGEYLTLSVNNYYTNFNPTWNTCLYLLIIIICLYQFNTTVCLILLKSLLFLSELFESRPVFKFFSVGSIKFLSYLILDPTYSPTCNEIESLGEGNVAWTVEELQAMTVNTFDSCGYALGEVSGFSQAQLMAVIEKAKSVCISLYFSLSMIINNLVCVNTMCASTCQVEFVLVNVFL